MTMSNRRFLPKSLHVSTALTTNTATQHVDKGVLCVCVSACVLDRYAPATIRYSTYMCMYGGMELEYIVCSCEKE